VCACVRACAGVPPNIYTHTYICSAIHIYTTYIILYMLAGGRDPPLCAGDPHGVVLPPCGPPAVLCAPLWWARAPCAAPPCGGFLPRVLMADGAPPRCCGPDRDHCYDRRQAAALDAFVRSLHGDTKGAATHTRLRVVCQEGWDGARRHPQPAAGVLSQQSSGAAASRRRSHSSATNNIAYVYYVRTSYLYLYIYLLILLVYYMLDIHIYK